jgi:hypothetical protein
MGIIVRAARQANHRAGRLARLTRPAQHGDSTERFDLWGDEEMNSKLPMNEAEISEMMATVPEDFILRMVSYLRSEVIGIRTIANAIREDEELCANAVQFFSTPEYKRSLGYVMDHILEEADTLSQLLDFQVHYVQSRIDTPDN